MIDVIVVLCLASNPDICIVGAAASDDCYRTVQEIQETVPAEYSVMKAISCARRPDLELEPMVIKPEKEETAA